MCVCVCEREREREREYHRNYNNNRTSSTTTGGEGGEGDGPIVDGLVLSAQINNAPALVNGGHIMWWRCHPSSSNNNKSSSSGGSGTSSGSTAAGRGGSMPSSGSTINSSSGSSSGSITIMERVYSDLADSYVISPRDIGCIIRCGFSPPSCVGGWKPHHDGQVWCVCVFWVGYLCISVSLYLSIHPSLSLYLSISVFGWLDGAVRCKFMSLSLCYISTSNNNDINIPPVPPP